MLREWCTFELHTVVLDFGDSPIESDGEQGASHNVLLSCPMSRERRPRHRGPQINMCAPHP